MMAATRLDPALFKIPLDKIRAGYYSDKYFQRVSEVLRKEGHNPSVLYQFFPRADAVVVGLDEAIAILKYCAGYYQDPAATEGIYQRLRQVQFGLSQASLYGVEDEIRRCSEERTRLRMQLNQAWVNCWDRIRVRALYDGDRARADEPILVIEGPQAYFAYLETVLLGVIARPTGTATATAKVVEAARGKPILFFSARFDHFWVQGTDGYAAMKAGAFGVSTDANADYWGSEGLGTIPHSLIGAYHGSTVEAALAFDRQIDGAINRIVLVDWDNDCIGTSFKLVEAFARNYHGASSAGEWARAVGPGPRKIWGVRFDTSNSLRDVSVFPHDEVSLGVAPELVHRARSAFDAGGLDQLKIVVSGGFDAERIALFEKLAVPVDAYGVGSHLLRRKVDITADVVQVEGVHCAKVGRRLGDLSRLDPVD
jgi:nicotinate phosphoribosyltransferase